jgi:hypothetical protein
METTPPQTTTPTQRVPATPSNLKTSTRKGLASGNNTPTKPGNPSEPSTFFKDYDIEARVAAYCNFNDTGAFKRFAVSGWVLPHYLHMVQLRNSAPQLNRRAALELLNTCKEHQFASNDEPSIVWPVNEDDKYSKDMQLGGIIAQMLRSLHSKECPQDIADKSNDAFRSTTRKELPRVDMSEVACPDFGPFKGETRLEPANRCMNILYYLMFATNPSNLEKKFGHKSWDQQKSITDNYRPAWMQPTVNSAFTKKRLPDEPVPIDENMANDTYPPVRMELKWNYNSKAREAAEYREYIDEEGLEGNLPELITSVEVNHHLNAYQFRDLVRVAYNMSEIGAQISSGRLVITYENFSTGQEKEEEDANEVAFNILQSDWEKIKQILWGPKKIQKSLLTFTTRPLGSSVLLEWGPINLERFIKEKYGDIVAVTPSEKPHSDPLEEDGDAQEENIVDQVVGSIGYSKKEFDPLELFEKDKERMVE